MADPITGNLQSMASGAMDTMTTVMWVIIWVSVILIPIIIAWHIMRHKHKVQIKYLTDNGAIVRFDKAREVNIDGAKFWKLLKAKALISTPPPDVIQVTKKGKLFASCYYSDELGYIWARDTVTKETFKAKVEDFEIVNGEKVKVTRNVYQPFTTQERALESNQVRKAAERRGSSLLDKIIQMLPFVMVFLMFVLVLIFWEDIAKPAVEISNANAGISTQNAKISEQNARILILLGYDNVTVNQQVVNGVPPDVRRQ